MNKILKIEALRGFVALYVACAHIFTLCSVVNIDDGIFYKLWLFGDAGVVVFFVISGFVIKLSYTKGRDKSFKSYFFKRLLRIYIPLVFVFLSTFFILYIQGNVGYISLANIVANLLMLQHLDTPLGFFFPLFGNSPLWSLSFEWWYYIIFFLLMTYMPKRVKGIVYVISIISTIIFIYHPIFFIHMLAYMSLWWFGVEMAELYMDNKRGNPFLFSKLIKPLFIIALSNIIIYLMTSSINPYLFKGFVFILIGLLWAKIKWFGYNSSIGLFTHFGKISYTLYISHFPLIVQATYLDQFISSFGMYRYIVYSIICLFFCYIVEVVLYPIVHQLFVKKINSYF